LAEIPLGGSVEMTAPVVMEVVVPLAALMVVAAPVVLVLSLVPVVLAPGSAR